MSAVLASSAVEGRSPSDPVRALQHALYRAAKADPGRRFHSLRDKVYRRDVLWRAWVNVRRKNGAEGIDQTTLAMVEEYGVTRLLEEPPMETQNRVNNREGALCKKPGTGRGTRVSLTNCGSGTRGFDVPGHPGTPSTQHLRPHSEQCVVPSFHFSVADPQHDDAISITSRRSDNPSKSEPLTHC